MEKCEICNYPLDSVLYEGKIRVGKFGNYSADSHQVRKCSNCLSGCLLESLEDYESSQYRQLVDISNNVNDFYAAHDNEVMDKLNLFNMYELRGKVIADVGTGAGSFLDSVNGLASQCIAIEPNKTYQKILQEKGYSTYSYSSDALEEKKNQVDIATCFAVIEHLADPVTILKDIKGLLKPDGVLLISTPNYDDWLLELLPEEYGSFFYRYVHKWYFNGDSLKKVAKIAGYSDISLKYVQQYDISNALLWLRDNRPTGLGKVKVLEWLDECYKNLIESQGKSNFLYAWLKP